MNYVHIWTSPDNQKESSTTPESMSCGLSMQDWQNTVDHGQSLEQSWKEKRFHGLQLHRSVSTEKIEAQYSSQLFNSRRRQVKPEKWTTVSLYLNELPV